MPPSPQKQHGAVYTPPNIVTLILDAALPPNADELAHAEICDPACGDGAFLQAAARRILTRLPRNDALTTLRRMTGYDIDRNALAQCQAQLDAELARWYPAARIQWQLQERNAFDRLASRPDCGRFTHIVGNPPYVRVQHLEQAGRRRIAGQWQVIRGATDSYLIFYELGLDLLRPGGVLGYIAPSSWLRSDSGSALRRILAANHNVRKIIDFGPHQVFNDVTTYTAIVIIQKNGPPRAIPVAKYDGAAFQPAGTIDIDPANPSRPWTAATDAERQRMADLIARGPRLSEIADIHVGIQTLADAVFILPASHRESRDLESWIFRDIVKASVMKNGQDPISRAVIFPYNDDGKLLPESYIAENAPKTYQWLLSHKPRLLNRDKGRFDPAKWYAFGRQVSITSGFGDKILTSGMNRRPNFQRCLDPAATFYSGYCIKPKAPVDLDRLLTALNSEAMEFFIRQTSRPYQGGWMSYARSFIQNFPVPPEVSLAANPPPTPRPPSHPAPGICYPPTLPRP